MTARAERTTTLAGPNRLVLAVATGGLVALASGGTALLVLSGTSAVVPQTALVPPLPASRPLAGAPGVVVLPSAPTAAAPAHRSGDAQGAVRRRAVAPPAPHALAAPVPHPLAAPLPHPLAAPRVLAPALPAALPGALAFVPAETPVPDTTPAAPEVSTPAQLRAVRAAMKRAEKAARKATEPTASADSVTPVPRLASLVRSRGDSEDGSWQEGDRQASPAERGEYRAAYVKAYVKAFVKAHGTAAHGSAPRATRHQSWTRSVGHRHDQWGQGKNRGGDDRQDQRRRSRGGQRQQGQGGGHGGGDE